MSRISPHGSPRFNYRFNGKQETPRSASIPMYFCSRPGWGSAKGPYRTCPIEHRIASHRISICSHGGS